MDKKIIIIAGLVFPVGIFIFYSRLTQPDTSFSAATNTAQAVQSAVDPAPVEVETTSESDAVVDDAPTGSEAVVEAGSENDDQSVAAVQPLAKLDLPKPENDLGDREFGWNQLLSRDAILPIYEPEFAPAENAPYDENELVIGVEINGEAKAYPIGPLNGREMVNDTVGGVPVLVTW